MRAEERYAVFSALRPALIASGALLILRLATATGLGFGDAEALYASYALHPQPAYLDHPGLIGAIARLLGGGGAPSPELAHWFTAVAATFLPWVGAGAARAAGASWHGTRRTALALLLCPELAIGLFGLTPDLPLGLCWLGCLWAWILALRSEPGSYRALLGFLLAGVLVGVGLLAKVSAILLLPALLAPLLGGPGRRHLATLGPIGTLLVAGLLASPVVVWEANRDWPMMTHRLVATQGASGFSLRNLGALLGGQLAYVTPPFLLGSGVVAHRLWRERRQSEVTRLLFAACWIPALPLTGLCLWSRVAEPHWLAPAYLSLAVYFGQIAPESEVARRRWRVLDRVAVGFSVVSIALVFLMVQTNLQPRLLGSRYVARYDLSNDLHAWGPGLAVVREAVDEARARTGHDPVLVGPHYIVCAQLHAGLGAEVQVGCRTPQGDDFRLWYPPRKWHAAPTILYVTDDRFSGDPRLEFPHRRVAALHRTAVYRGTTRVRTLRVIRLDKVVDFAKLGAGDLRPAPERPDPRR